MNYFQQSRLQPATSFRATAASPSISDVATFISDGLIAPLIQGVSQVALNFSETMGLARSARAARDRTHKHECGCETERACQCTCCIVDADVAIYAHLGETRIFTFVVENTRVREKDVKVSLGGFTDRAGKAAPVKGVLFPPTEFKLAPCASQVVVMAIETGPLAGSSGGSQPGAVAEKLLDVEDCTVYYSDLRVDGCEIRPLRIALAILPRDCGAYKIECRSCCC